MNEARYLAALLTDAAGPPPPELSWTRLAAMARAERVEPLVRRAAAPWLPSDIAEALDLGARKVAFATVRTLAERDRVLLALAAAAVAPVVLLKGAVLGWLAYPDPGLRAMNDLDLLVRDGEGAGRALTALGYREIDCYPGRPASRGAAFERLFARPLVPGRVNQPIEVHTGFAEALRYPVAYDDVLARALRFPEGGPGAHRLEDVDQLLHLAVHLAREQFQGPLKHLLDVHRWVQRGSLDWDEAIRRADAWGARTSLAESLRLSAEVFGTPLPHGLLDALGLRGARRLWLSLWNAPREGRMVRWRLPIRASQALTLAPLMDTPRQCARFLFGYARLRLSDRRTGGSPAPPR